ncbi:AAA family ATPase [Chlorogloea sp. CCALA 695]|uniref:AAA family ATPase n=1 Tax=Chlorogloea sp. CCALA 695 TaxID=2107693 RepID=UPI0013049F7F|nr:AAA family ATPase [Chlorogloea sp. CCALA 695]
MHQLSFLAETTENSVTTIVQEDRFTALQENKGCKVPLDFDQIVGQKLAIAELNSAIATNRVPPAYLFAGIDGIGKTLAARIVSSKLLNTNNFDNHPDLLWIEPTYLHQGNLISADGLKALGITRASEPGIRVEQVREIDQFLSTSAINSNRKVVVIADAHLMNTTAANALLKTLEEPGGNNCIILLTCKPLLPTIASRCAEIPFRPLSTSEMALVLQKLDRTDVLSNPTVLDMATGSPGQAIVYDQIYRSLPPKLLKLKPPGADNSILAAVQVSKQIKELGLEQQRWLLDFLQYQWWTQYQDSKLVAKVEAAKSALNKSVSPRLVWDILLMPINK